jgi:hypothetical protein
VKYLLTDRAKKHVEGHFAQNAKSGSIFRQDYFPTIESLLIYILDLEPIREIIQSEYSVAHLYKINALEYVGWEGVGKMSDYPKAKVQEENRNGYMTRFMEIEDLPQTKFVNIVFKYGLNGMIDMEMITVFPGMYAPAFPSTSMTKDDFQIASEFWDEHILLKKESGLNNTNTF